MEIIVKTVINSPVDSNCHIIFEKKSKNCVVVDPGTSDCIELINVLNDLKLVPRYIVLTHEHFDHIWGVNNLKDIYCCQIVCSKICSERIVLRKKNLSVFHNNVGFETYPADLVLGKRDNLKLNNLEFFFFETPGHTDGSICFSIQDKLFTGDTIIMNNKTVTKLPGGCKIKLKESLDYIYSLYFNTEMTIYSGHGNSFKMSELVEKLYHCI